MRASSVSRSMTVLRKPIALGGSICFAHVRPLFGMAVRVGTGVVIDLRLRVRPDDGLTRAVRLGLAFVAELSCRVAGRQVRIAAGTAGGLAGSGRLLGAA